MNLERYPVRSYDDQKRFEFVSKGPIGNIKKVVLFQRQAPNFFNLAFGDWDKKKRTINSQIRSNNGDRDKVLATVAYSVAQFFNRYVHAEISIQGESKSRTRLYQMGINKYFDEISISYQVEGYHNGTLEKFRPGKNYERIILRKNIKL